MKIGLFAAVALLATLPACASITRGTTETVYVEVDPIDAEVTTSVGYTCTQTATANCEMVAPRSQEFAVTAAKPGYESQTVQVTTRMSGAGTAGIVGNVLLGGIIGVGIDAASGATLDHYPNPVIIALEPTDPGNRATPAGSREAIQARIDARAADEQRRRSASGPQS
jgi:hypothetical protein